MADRRWFDVIHNPTLARARLVIKSDVFKTDRGKIYGYEGIDVEMEGPNGVTWLLTYADFLEKYGPKDKAAEELFDEIKRRLADDC